MRANRSLLTALFVLAAISVIPATASAKAAPQLWNVDFTGGGTYTLASNDGSGNSTNADAYFGFSSKYSTVALGTTFGGVALPKKSSVSGKWNTTVVSNDGTHCSGSGGFAFSKSAPTGITGKKKGSSYLFYPSGIPTTGLLESPAGSNDCSNLSVPKSDFWNDWLTGYSHMGTDYPGEIVTPTIKLTKSEQKKKKLVFPVAMNPFEGIDAGCDGAPGCSQKYKWTGKVTLTRVTKFRS